MQPTTPMQVFKYYRFDSAGFEALYDTSLWLSNPQYFKDPHDSSLNFLIAYEKQQDRSFRIKDIEEIRSNLGVCCFTKTWSDVRMWREYADNSKGFCIEYDLSVYENALNQIGIPMILKPVQYFDYPYYFDGNALQNHLKNFQHKDILSGLDSKQRDIFTESLILLKDQKLFGHEKEIRLIVSSVLAERAERSNLLAKEEKGYRVKLPKGCIKRIFFGSEVEHLNTNKVADFLTINNNYFGGVATRWVKLGSLRGELVADQRADAEISDIQSSSFRIYGDK